MRIAGIFVAMLASLFATPADAVCDATRLYRFSFGNLPAATLTYTTNATYTAATTGGATRPFTMTLTSNGFNSTVVNGVQLPAIGTLMTGSDDRRNLVLGGTFSGRTAAITGTTLVATVTFTFTQPVRDFTMTVNDIDYALDQYRDLIMVTGTAAGVTYTPVLTTPWGNSNANGASRTAAQSSATLGPATVPMTLMAAQATGSGQSDNNSETGTITASFAQPVTSVTFRYGNAPYGAGEDSTGQQAIGIAGVAFCPMPEIAVAKSSAPSSGTLGAYAIPGNDIVYTLTVTNNGASPVDAGSIILTDVLPTTTTFRNTALAGGVPFSIASGSSGVTLSSLSPAYSNNGTTFGYTPASGYDPNVKAVRITPTGTMAANSSFAISFVAQVK